MTRFVGLESWPEQVVDPRALRRGYLEEYRRSVTAIKAGCLNNRIDYVPVSTDQPLDVVLTAYLATRASTRSK